jgi:hypothetical protein
MKKLALLILAVTLVGCSTAPIVPKWPAVPDDLKQACPDLSTVDPLNDKLSVVVESVADNYKQYYDCKAKVNDWIEWYQGQQKIWEKLK